MSKIALAIKSCHRYAERRAAQQETWLQTWPHDFYYLIGKPYATPVADALHCDVSDAFADIAPKILHACRYALEQNTEHLVVCDDDTYIRPERLLASGFEKFDYFGFLRVSLLDYNKGIPYAQGSCYTLSARAMERIVLAADIMQPGIIDDGAVGQALIGKVPFTHAHLFNPGPEPEPVLPSNEWISMHKALPPVMRQLHYPWRHM